MRFTCVCVYIYTYIHTYIYIYMYNYNYNYRYVLIIYIYMYVFYTYRLPIIATIITTVFAPPGLPGSAAQSEHLGTAKSYTLWARTCHRHAEILASPLASGCNSESSGDSVLAHGSALLAVKRISSPVAAWLTEIVPYVSGFVMSHVSQKVIESAMSAR